MDTGPRRRRVSRGARKRRRRAKAPGKQREAVSKEELEFRKRAQKFARKFIDWYSTNFNVSLTYDVDSVRALDNLLVLDTAQNLVNDEIVLQMGFFLGEIMRRNFGGEYHYSYEYDALILKCQGISVFPILKIKKSLEYLAIPIVGIERTAGLEEYMFSFARMLSNKRIEEGRQTKDKVSSIDELDLRLDEDDEDEDENEEVIEIPLPPDSKS
ncbi:MAG: hypothetical protein E3J72_22130 [Planctomycetota bacterium]|nr:MAG: hypothetical protein E3J72_22130 [Planctomycetota bacterium]